MLLKYQGLFITQYMVFTLLFLIVFFILLKRENLTFFLGYMKMLFLPNFQIFHRIYLQTRLKETAQKAKKEKWKMTL